MNTPRTDADRAQKDRAQNNSDIARAGEAGGQHQPVRRPDHDQPVEQRLDDVGLDDRGDVLEDELRDRRSRGGPPDTQRNKGKGKH